MSLPSPVERAERVALGRARVLPVIGVLIIVLDAVFSGPIPASWTARAMWVVLFLLGFGLVMTGGVWPGQLRRIIEDETTRAFRRQALSVGYCATFACLMGLLVTSFFVALPAAQALEITLTTAVAAPMIGFGIMEQNAIGHG